MAVSIPALILALWGGVLLKERHDRNHAISIQLGRARPQLDSAKASGAMAQDRRVAALERFDSGDSEVGERIYAEARQAYARAELAYQEAARSLETALQLDHGPGAARELLGEAIYERAVLAEAFFDESRKAELLERLQWLDVDGHWTKRWWAPASLEIRSEPAAATVSLRSYRQVAGRRELGPASALGTTPLVTRLPPGSYLLTVDVAGREPARYPVLLSRDERVALDIPLPATVPPGYVYIAPGRFLYGSAEQDDFRRSVLMATPQHSVTLSGYLVGRHEVTYGEWIDYLESLPVHERDEHLPFADRLRLTANNGGYELSISPSSIEYRVAVGRPLVYAEREHRRQQDWAQLPVSGISSADGAAYATWLAGSRGLTGARICTDREWERAARGADARTYPHGDVLAPEDADFDHTYGQRPGGFGPDEVGSHPASDSPWGVSDLSGNVWEYVRDATNPAQLFLRGGGFYDDPISQRVTNRAPTEPLMRDRMTGLRICADVPAR
jgi:formylglycine-generating enzyme required for sulfatase activity